ncbi:glucose dehydrogenase [FAD, quinone]-like, partial [Agrilus planipennis]|uniref:Glucose dehydrogenase [FAD, quinone]-like n=1 Tax=Agrilus planipennis TaxID=224129 RepID=A0A1W4WY11_AGRPL
VPAMVVNFQDTPIDWAYQTESEPVACLGYPDEKCSWPRGKVLGGTSVLNGMMYMRGQPKDYDNWKEAGNEGWGYNDVFPYFLKSEDNLEIGTLVDRRYHARGGYMTVSRFPNQPEIANDILAAAWELGYPISNDLTGEQYSGFAIAQACVRNGGRLSSARAFLRPNNVRRRPNLHILLNATATRLQFNNYNNKKSVKGVEVLVNNRKSYTIRVRKEIVLSAGAINSPQILLLSGVGPKKVLNDAGIQQVHELPGVGANLQNHVAFYMVFNLLKQNNTFDLNWPALLDYVIYKRGPLASTGMSQITARINSRHADASGTYPDLQLFFGGYSANCANTGEVNALRNASNPVEPRQIYISPVALHTKSRGYIALNSSNPLDPPLMFANYLTAPEDMAVMIDGVRVCQALANTNVLKEKYGIEMADIPYGDCADRYIYNSDEYWDCAIRHSTGPENHQSGTCKMGPTTDPMAVINPKLQVYGIDGLRVMDASVMPTLVSGNTHATIVMIAEKGSDMIKQRWLGNNYSKDKTKSQYQKSVSNFISKPPYRNNWRGGYLKQ